MLFDPTTLSRPTTAFTWSFETPADLEPWQHGDSAWRLGEHGAILDAAEPRPDLERAVALDAGTIDTLVVETVKFFGSAELRWAGPDHDLEAAGVTAPARHGAKPGPDRLIRFDLEDHPGWSGRIERIRLIFEPNHAGPFTLHRIDGTRDVFQPELLRDAAARPWKFEVGDTVKTALLAVPGQPIEHRLEAPPQAELRFSIGVPETLPVPVRFRIAAVTDAGDRKVLFERTSTPRAEAKTPAEWWDETLDLSGHAGKRLRLLLETETEAPLTSDTGFPAWANVELLGRRPGAAPPNVVLISIDTLRADRLSTYGHHRPTSPHIDAWAHSSAVVFERAVAPAPWTQPSHVSMFSGLDAHRHGVNGFDAAPESLRLLAEILRQADYATAAMTGGGLLHPRFGLTQGFDAYYAHRQEYSNDELEIGLDRALSWLDANSTRPFFLFFHTYEVHGPYIARQPYFSRWSDHDPELEILPWVREPGDKERANFTYLPPGERGEGLPLPPELASLPSDRYDSAVAYTDAMLEGLFEWLRANGLERPTLVVLTSDHGEMLGEHGLANHGHLYDENLLVPLIIAPPDGRGAGQRVDEQVRLIDLLPTVLDLVGLPAPDGIDGVSLAALIEGKKSRARRPAWSYAAHSRRGLSLRLDNRLKYIRRISAVAPEQGREWLFDLVDDPREMHNLLAAGSDDGATTATSQRGETLRELLFKTWETESSGVRMRFDNPGDRPFQGTMQGPPTAARNLKSIDLACSCVTVEGGVASFRVPPATSYTLAFERWRAGSRGIFLTVGYTEETQQGMRFNPDPASVQVAADVGGTWRMVDSKPLDSGIASITTWWHGDQELETTAPVEYDEELTDALRALGYLP